jgi:primary-amine oxidase
LTPVLLLQTRFPNLIHREMPMSACMRRLPGSAAMMLIVLFLLVTVFAEPAAESAQAEPAKPAGLVEWEGWKFHWHVRQREGLALTDVSFYGKSVLKYAGLAEIFVPYNIGQPRFYDVVENPLGKNMILLKPGRDCLPGGVCRGFSAQGQPEDQNPVVMLHDEQPSLIYLTRTSRAHGKMLTLWSAYQLGNYTYILQWRFRSDGCLMPQIGMTGSLNSFGGSELTSSNVGAPKRALAHTHNFVFCLDFDIDGPANSVEEFEYKATSELRTVFHTQWRPIETETVRAVAPEQFRSWRVVNRASKNKHGNPRSYELVPGGTGIFRGRIGSDGKGSEKFAFGDFWVTRSHPGEVPNLRPLSQALPSYLNEESVVDEDVAVWYMVSAHHQPRSEDYRPMPVEWVGFKLQPRDFLDNSPLKTTGLK